MILRRPTNEGVVGLLKAVLWSKFNYQRCRNNDLFVGRSPILGKNVFPIAFLSNNLSNKKHRNKLKAMRLFKIVPVSKYLSTNWKSMVFYSVGLPIWININFAVAGVYGKKIIKLPGRLYINRCALIRAALLFFVSFLFYFLLYLVFMTGGGGELWKAVSQFWGDAGGSNSTPNPGHDPAGSSDLLVAAGAGNQPQEGEMLVIPSPEISQGELLGEADAAPAGPEADAVSEEDLDAWLNRIKSEEGKKKFQSPLLSALNKLSNLPSKGGRFRPGQPELDSADLSLLKCWKKRILKLLCSKELRSPIKVTKGQWEAALEKLLEGRGPYDWLTAGKAIERERERCPFFRRLVDEVERMKFCQKRKGKGKTTSTGAE
uniref:Orf35 n=1 Tax=Daucus carota subsp. sativus TaxID=79200 RepID=I1TIE3_DAUCS|nr:orf35 [Daucus carota subsp. sativus]AEY81173.1 orf35 [Daucus carota subsp. sativus]